MGAPPMGGIAIFLPFSYFMDSLTHRAYQRRLNRDRRG
jgi:hypothetical protein